MSKKTSKAEVAPATSSSASHQPYITLPWSAFFDQELGDVIYNKLMKAPVKDYQVLLWLSKLGSTVNNIAKELVVERDKIAEEVGFDKSVLQGALTPEMLNSAEYQEKSKKFWELLQERIFSKTFCLEPLGCLHLDLTNPDGHAKSFLEWANLSADDLLKLWEAGILSITEEWEVDEPADPTPAKEEEKKTEEVSEEKTDEADDVLVPNDK